MLLLLLLLLLLLQCFQLTAVAAGWLQPAEVPPPACGEHIKYCCRYSYIQIYKDEYVINMQKYI